MFLAPLVILADAPDVQVARVSYSGGDASYQRGDSDGWNALDINTPLVAGDSLYTADDGRAEVHLGSGNVLRLDAGTQVDLLSNTRDLAQLGLRSGYLSLRARSRSGSGTLEIDTPAGAATVLQPGTYRVELDDRVARYSVVKGRLSVSLSGQQIDVEAGESLAIEGTDEPRYTIDPIAPQSAFDEWARDRDVRAERSRSARYVHPDVVGYEDLDDQGTWRETPDYGRVWTPSGVPSGWAPYQAGSWMWQDPYGWTWVSNESWGWAPYHYGRWVSVGGAWGWVPPPPVGFHGPSIVAEIRPTYAPALVAFVGGKNWSAGISLGGGPAIGWVPLAPAERYYYPWQSAPRVTNNYTNITVINAVTIVNATKFASGPIHPIRVSTRQVIHAPILGYTAKEVVPTHDSLCASRPRDAHSKFVPHRDDDRPLIVRTTPPPRPVPFHEKVIEIQRTGRPFEGHDRGEHTGWNGHGDRNDRVATVSALSPEGPKELKPQPGTIARPTQRIDPRVDMAPRLERAYPKESGEVATRPEQIRERPQRREPERSAQTEPVERIGSGERNNERHASTSESGHESHVATSTEHAPHPATVTPAVTVERATPQHEAAKPEAPKAKNDKAKGKDKHADEGQQQDR
jgi:hypothetical protein